MCSGGVLVGFWWGSGGFRRVLVGSGWFWWVLVDSERVLVGSGRLCWGYFVSGKFWWVSGVVLVGSGGVLVGGMVGLWKGSGWFWWVRVGFWS